jgi:uncharacterized membrane protein (UPF0127 family)
VIWLRLTTLLAAFVAVSACGNSTGSTVSTSLSASSATTAIIFQTGSVSTPQLQMEIANTPSEREVGLMNRSSLGANAGMLFVFPSDTNAAFWMKDTLIPLSIAFVKADGTIVHIEDMQPQTETNHYSTEPYRYAIEANVGWFAADGISAGNKAEIPSGISATS